MKVGEVARLVGISVRTLHHYDDIGLVVPSDRTPKGYRSYSAADVERLHRVLTYRELGFALDDIATLLDDPTVDAMAHLQRQRDLLDERIDRLHRMAAAVDKMMEAKKMGIQLTPDEQREVFGDDWLGDEYAGEAEERWGDTEAWKQSQERTGSGSRPNPTPWTRILPRRSRPGFPRSPRRPRHWPNGTEQASNGTTTAATSCTSASARCTSPTSASPSTTTTGPRVLPGTFATRSSPTPRATADQAVGSTRVEFATVSAHKPDFGQYLGYQFGRVLPPSMQDWVRDDLVGTGAQAWYLIRFTLPVVPLLALFLLIPGPLWIGLAMMALLFIPLVYFTIALMNVYRRHRLLVHGLDPALLNADAQARVDRTREDYERRHGRLY